MFKSESGFLIFIFMMIIFILLFVYITVISERLKYKTLIECVQHTQNNMETCRLELSR